MTKPDMLELVSRYANAYDGLKIELDQLSEEQVRLSPEPGKWCVKEIVFHLADAEIILSERMKRIIAEPHPQLLAFDQERFAESLLYKELDMRSALLIFGLLREMMTALFEKLPEETWNRAGTHSVRGETTLSDTLKHAVQHADVAAVKTQGHFSRHISLCAVHKTVERFA